MIQITSGAAITLILAFLGMVGTYGWILLGQFDKRLSEKLNAQNELRETQVETLERDLNAAAATIKELAEKHERFNTTLPLEYVRREDWIRFCARIEARFDGLAQLIMGRSLLPGQIGHQDSGGAPE